MTIRRYRFEPVRVSMRTRLLTIAARRILDRYPNDNPEIPLRTRKGLHEEYLPVSRSDFGA
jgi:hypothetical protein